MIPQSQIAVSKLLLFLENFTEGNRIEVKAATLLSRIAITMVGCIWLAYCSLAGSLASIYRPVYHTSTMSTVDFIVLEHLDRRIHHFDCSGLAEVLLKST